VVGSTVLLLNEWLVLLVRWSLYTKNDQQHQSRETEKIVAGKPHASPQVKHIGFAITM